MVRKGKGFGDQFENLNISVLEAEVYLLRMNSSGFLLGNEGKRHGKARVKQCLSSAFSRHRTL